jgi:hypothetical protein
MDRRVRAALWVVAAIQAVMALGFVFQVPAVTGVCPFPGTTPLTNIFIGSIFAAAAASTTWCLVMARPDSPGSRWTPHDPRAVLAVPFAHAAGGADGAVAMAAFGVASAAGPSSASRSFVERRHRWRDPRPTPRLVADRSPSSLSPS